VEFFDDYAADFDSIYQSGSGPFQKWINHFLRKSMRLRFELTLAACDPVEEKSVLDVGCGPGHYCLALARKGANVLGIDFAPAMIELARQKAREAGLDVICSFAERDFAQLGADEVYDYTIMMGFLDYIPDAGATVRKALDHTRQSAFFSFPVSGGFLAWQRKLRYKRKCPLYLYSHEEVMDLFAKLPGIRFRIRKIGRDFWVRADKTK